MISCAVTLSSRVGRCALAKDTVPPSSSTNGLDGNYNLTVRRAIVVAVFPKSRLHDCFIRRTSSGTHVVEIVRALSASSRFQKKRLTPLLTLFPDLFNVVPVHEIPRSTSVSQSANGFLRSTTPKNGLPSPKECSFSFLETKEKSALCKRL